jgi:hypothetical protein
MSVSKCRASNELAELIRYQGKKCGEVCSVLYEVSANMSPVQTIYMCKQRFVTLRAWREGLEDDETA